MFFKAVSKQLNHFVFPPAVCEFCLLYILPENLLLYDFVCFIICHYPTRYEIVFCGFWFAFSLMANDNIFLCASLPFVCLEKCVFIFFANFKIRFFSLLSYKRLFTKYILPLLLYLISVVFCQLWSEIINGKLLKELSNWALF